MEEMTHNSTLQQATASLTLLQTMVPKFSDTNCAGAAKTWLVELSHSFQLCEETYGAHLPDRLKVAFAASRLEGSCRQWYQTLMQW